MNVTRPTQAQLTLNFPGLSVDLQATNSAVLDDLADYYQDYRDTPQADTRLPIWVVDTPVPADWLDQPWQPVARPTAQQTLKEAYLDTPDGRWIHKTRTGMLMLQRPIAPAVVGDCRANLSQVVNFINNQWINAALNQGRTLGHASAFAKDGVVTAIAASSGGGKSTLMLRCLEDPETAFVSNDRILFTQNGAGCDVLGVPKLPRVNPGTLLYSDRLRQILPADRQAELSQLSPDALRGWEEKYDVPIGAFYGAGRVTLTGPLTRLFMLDWQPDSAAPTAIEHIDLTVEPTAIEGLRKQAGPFYQDAQGHFPDLGNIPSHAHYAAQLNSVQVFRVTGRVDFHRAAELIGAIQ